MLPFVSVIIPHLNNEAKLKACLDGLTAQTYPAERTEIIVVDNGSEADVRAIVAAYPGVQFLEETSMKSPYPCRNKGILASKGELLALVDSNCRVERQYLEEGVRRMTAPGADFGAGRLDMELAGGEPCWEMADMFYSRDGDAKNVVSARGATTFAWRYVFEQTGLYLNDIRSGGDREWSMRAKANGFRLVYLERARAFYYAKGKKASLKRSVRVGKGKADFYLLRAKKSFFETAAAIVQYMRPPNPFIIYRWLKSSGLNSSFLTVCQVAGCFWVNKWFMLGGFCDFIIRKKN